MMTQTTQLPQAIVIGGSLAGLLTARVLSNHFTQVTLLERDKINDQPEARKGQPQTRHLHGLLAKGLATMSTYFPTLVDDLTAGGAFVTDMGLGMRWYAFGGYRQQSVGEDFRYPETEGKKPAGADLINAYVTKVHQTTHQDTTVYTAFLKVMNLMEAPTSLFHPKILWRVLWRNQRSQTTAAMPQPEMAYSGD